MTESLADCLMSYFFLQCGIVEECHTIRLKKANLGGGEATVRHSPTLQVSACKRMADRKVILYSETSVNEHDQSIVSPTVLVRHGACIIWHAVERDTPGCLNRVPRCTSLRLVVITPHKTMTIYSRASSRPSSSSVSLCCILSDDEISVEVLLAAASRTAAAVSTTTPSVSSSHSSLPRRSIRRQILHPPETVILAPQPSIVPYAQLCFHKDSNTISTMLVGSKTSDEHGGAPNLTFSADSDDESGSGWSTGCSSNGSDYYEDYRHRSHGVVWISREWWTRDNHDTTSNDERALLPELHLTRSSSSEESTASFLSLKSCGKLFCQMRKSEHRGSYHPPAVGHATKGLSGRGYKSDNGNQMPE